jgi:hypothetical protein
MSESINYDNEEIFGGDDFVFTKANDPKTGDSIIVGGGYKVNSFFLQGGLPAMTTLNKPDQNGGKVSSPFENLAVPAGLFYINQRVPKGDLDTDKKDHYYKQHEMLSDDMVDKLFGLVEADKKRKRSTRKHIGKLDKTKIDKKKTRRYR